MANSLHLSQKRRVRNHSKKNKEEEIIIISARYIHEFSIAITFSNGKTNLLNFLPLFEKYVKGDNLKYFAPGRFKKFIVKNGNLYWGRNEELILPASLLYKGSSAPAKKSDKILYII